MNTKVREQILTGLTQPGQLGGVATSRKRPYTQKSFPHELVEKQTADGWIVQKIFKTKTRMRQPKPDDIAFEDEVWTTMANLGFGYLNKERNFKIPYSDALSLTQQIDVFAADDETILLFECKSSQGEPKKGDFKETIEAIGGKRAGIHEALKQLFPDKKHKVKFILATNNYVLSGPDQERLDNFDILHIDEEGIKYYRDLAKNLGLSARYQLLGNLFEGQKIPEIENKVPAIEGKMGGHTYYSFLIEPEKLLKIGYVLHRNKANKKLMPTYQRLIKKTRLKAVQRFVEDGGFFPNSLIIDIEIGERKDPFYPAELQDKSTDSRIGILHLPQKYRSAFIIDGQHRLYGYANSEYRSSNTVPVVAFVNLARREQVRLFMQINENQKAVQKSLRHTLNSDLLWDSEYLTDQVKALKLQIAQDLGEEESSPLYERVILGENPKTPTRCITIDTIKIGLDRSNYFGVFSKSAIKKDGTFYRGNNQDTYDVLFPFLEGCFAYMKEKLGKEWDKGESDDGFISINAGIESLIRVISDIIDHLVAAKRVNPKSDKTEVLIAKCTPYMDSLIYFFQQIPPERRTELKRSYGTGARSRYWRTLQKTINEDDSEFSPSGMSQYWRDEAQLFNEESFKIIRDIETHLKSDFMEKLRGHHGVDWFKTAVPKSVYDDTIKRAADKNRTISSKEDDVEPWDCLHIIDYRKIAIYERNWSEIFEKHYTKPGEEQLRGGKEAKTGWMQKTEAIRNENVHSYRVKEEEYEFLGEIHEWLITHKVESNR